MGLLFTILQTPSKSTSFISRFRRLDNGNLPNSRSPDARANAWFPLRERDLLALQGA
jgi:hypothetical protein